MRAPRTLALGAAVALATTGLVTAPAATAHPHHPHPHGTTASRFAQDVDLEDVWRHLRAFQRIADRHGSRADQTPGYEASARYVEQTLRKAGYRPYRDHFTYEEEVVDAATLTVGDLEVVVDQMQYSPSTTEAGVTAPLVAPSDTLGCTEAAYDDAVVGAIALVSRGECPFADKALAAEAAGAVGAVVYNNVPDELLNGTLGTEGLVGIPVAGATLEDGQALVALLDDGAPTATLDLRFHVGTFESFNVIAETRRGRDDNVVMLGAHLDGVPEGAGINDNGTGSAAILEVATELAKVRKHHNTVRFAWWGAEEVGLEGSTAYVEELATQEGELDRIATYLNFDMIGSPNYVIGVYDADESTHEAPVPVPPGSAETEDVFTDYFDRIGQPWVDTEFSGRSDYQAFIANGIPASGLFTGADGEKSAEEVALFGGTEGIPYDPSYHSPDDDITNVDPTALRIMTRAIAYATFSLAQDTEAVNGVVSPEPTKPGKPKPGKPGKPKPGKPGKPGPSHHHVPWGHRS